MNSFQTSRFCLFGETSVRSQTYWKRSHDTAGVLGEGVHRGFKCRGPPVGRPCNQSWTWRRKESDVQHKMRENSVRVCARACACVCACVCVCPQDNRQWQQQQLTRESLRLLSSPPHTHTHTLCLAPPRPSLLTTLLLIPPPSLPDPPLRDFCISSFFFLSSFISPLPPVLTSMSSSVHFALQRHMFFQCLLCVYVSWYVCVCASTWVCIYVFSSLCS